MKLAPSLIETISFSQHAKYQTCALALAFQRDSAHSELNRVTPASLLGMAAHSTAERVVKSRLEGVTATTGRQVVEQIWDQECAKRLLALRNAWSPAEVPLPADWDGYAVTRSRVLRHLTPKVWFREPAAAPAAAPLAHAEYSLVDQTAGILGVPDLVEERTGEWWILDLKSGLRQGEPTEAQEAQLLLYAHLFRVARGRLPDHLAVVTASGVEHEIAFTETRVLDAVAAVVRSRDEFNKLVATGAYSAAARPTEEHCRWCSYRIACDPFMAQCQESWLIPNTLRGTVQSTCTRMASTEATVEVSAPTWRAGQPIRIIDVAWPRPVLPGEAIAISNFATEASWSLIRGRWNTLIWLGLI